VNRVNRVKGFQANENALIQRRSRGGEDPDDSKRMVPVLQERLGPKTMA
jgi:hypothetical protein